MASSFLENLKKSVEEGEFNSEAAKKILEIAELADRKAKGMTVDELNKNVGDRVKESGLAKPVSEEEALELNSEYEKKMAEIKLIEDENKRVADLRNMIDTQLKTLIEIEEMVKASFEDMHSFVDELENKFEKEFDEENPMFADLAQKIDEISNKYSSININN